MCAYRKSVTGAERDAASIQWRGKCTENISSLQIRRYIERHRELPSYVKVFKWKQSWLFLPTICCQ